MAIIIIIAVAYVHYVVRGTLVAHGFAAALVVC